MHITAFPVAVLAVTSLAWPRPARAGDLPARADSLLRAAISCYQDGAFGRAIDLLQTSGAIRTAEADYYLGSSFAALNDPQNAIRYLRAAVDSAPETIPYRLQLAKCLTAFGAVADARDQYRRILERDSAFVPALFNLGTLCFDGRDYTGASNLFARCVRVNPRDYLGYFNLGASLINLGMPDSAIRFLHASLTLNSRHVPTLNLLATLYYKRKEYLDAERLYGMIVARDSGNADAWTRRGYCYEKLKEWPAAARCFRKAATIDTANATCWAHLGQACFELKQFDSSAASYMRAGALEPENPVLYLNAGLAYASMDSSHRALDAFHRSFAEYHVERLGFLYDQIAGTYYKQKRFRQAESYYRRSLAYDARNAKAMFFLAHAQEELREYKEAVTTYRRFVQVAAGDKTAGDLVRYAKKRIRELSAGQ